jgi:hypothetical protein
LPANSPCGTSTGVVRPPLLLPVVGMDESPGIENNFLSRTKRSHSRHRPAICAQVWGTLQLNEDRSKSVRQIFMALRRDDQVRAHRRGQTPRGRIYGLGMLTKIGETG